MLALRASNGSAAQKKMPKIRSESIAFQNGKNQRRHMYNCVAPRKKRWANSKAKRYTQRGSISRSNVINQEGTKRHQKMRYFV